MFSLLVQGLRAAGLAVSVEELSEILWLAERWPEPSDGQAPSPGAEHSLDGADEDEDAEDEDLSPDTSESAIEPQGQSNRPVDRRPTPLHSAQMSGTLNASTLRVPGVSPIKRPEDLRRALQPFARRVPSRWRSTLDEDETASMAAETRVWVPVYRPSRERWFEISVVAEDTPSMALWRDALDEFTRLLRNQGRFRSVSGYRLDANGIITAADRHTGITPSRLLDPQRRHLILLATDASSPQWWGGPAHHFLHEASAAAATSLLMVMPRRAWKHTAVGEPEVSVFAPRPGDTTSSFQTLLPWWLDNSDVETSLSIPVVGLDPSTIGEWARTMTGRALATVPGLLVAKPRTDKTPGTPSGAIAQDTDPVTRVARFRRIVSEDAYNLAIFLSVPDPLTVPVMRLVQRTMLPDTGTAELAEFFVGGLLELARTEGADAMTREPGYRLDTSVRQELERSLRYSEEGEINAQLRSVGRMLMQEGEQGRSFEAMFPSPSGVHHLTPWSLPFASLSREVIGKASSISEHSEGLAALAPEKAKDPWEVAQLSYAVLAVDSSPDGTSLTYDLHVDRKVTRRVVEPYSGLDGLKEEVRNLSRRPEALDDLAGSLMPRQIRSELDGLGALVLAIPESLEFMPWELVVRSWNNNTNFFALNHPLVRILTEAPLQRAPERDRDVRHLPLVVADPDGALPDLPGAREEAHAVANVLGRLPSNSDLDLVIRASESEVLQKLADTPFTVLFLSGHGVRVQNRFGNFEVGLQLGTKHLRVEHVLARPSPPEVVFLACNYLAAWAPRLLTAGVRVVIAALDTVQDNSLFPVRFFESLVDGGTLAEAVLAARRACFTQRKSDSDQSWAEYACYGNPDFRLVGIVEGVGASSAQESSAVPSGESLVHWVWIASHVRDAEVAERLRSETLRALEHSAGITEGLEFIVAPRERDVSDESWTNWLDLNIRNCAALIFVLSEEGIGLPLLQREMDLAFKLDIPVMTVFLNEASQAMFNSPTFRHRRRATRAHWAYQLRLEPGDSGDREGKVRELAKELAEQLPEWRAQAETRRPAPIETLKADVFVSEASAKQSRFLMSIPLRGEPSATTVLRTAIRLAEGTAVTYLSDDELDSHRVDSTTGPKFEFVRLNEILDPIVDQQERTALAIRRERLREIGEDAPSLRKLAIVRETLAQLDNPDNVGRLRRGALTLPASAHVLYAAAAAYVRFAISLVADVGAGRLRIEAAGPTAPWPLPREAIGAPVIVAGRCVGLVAQIADADGDETLICGADLLHASLRAACVIQVERSTQAHQQWLESDGRKGRSLRAVAFDLAGVKWAQRNFRKAHMRGVIFQGAELGGANFREAMLVDADFRDADVTGSDFSGAQLRGARFERARISGCKWQGADIDSVRFDASAETDPEIRVALTAQRAVSFDDESNSFAVVFRPPTKSSVDGSGRWRQDTKALTQWLRDPQGGNVPARQVRLADNSAPTMQRMVATILGLARTSHLQRLYVVVVGGIANVDGQRMLILGGDDRRVGMELLRELEASLVDLVRRGEIGEVVFVVEAISTMPVSDSVFSSSPFAGLPPVSLPGGYVRIFGVTSTTTDQSLLRRILRGVSGGADVNDEGHFTDTALTNFLAASSFDFLPDSLRLGSDIRFTTWDGKPTGRRRRESTSIPIGRGLADRFGLQREPVIMDLRWRNAFRLVPSRLPTEGLFDGVSSSEDVALAIERLTNPRLRAEAGNLDLVPPEDRVLGRPGSTLIMSPFVHLNPEGSRFSDGTFGVLYASDTLESAIAELSHHYGAFMSATKEPPREIDLRIVMLEISAQVCDLRDPVFRTSRLFDPDSYELSAEFGAQIRARGIAGVLYPSLRRPGGVQVALFKPQAVVSAAVGAVLSLQWDGQRVIGWTEKRAPGPR